ncbi:MAG: hypothetical protein ACK5KU_10125 [Beutenbergiaceae bacterium]
MAQNPDTAEQRSENVWRSIRTWLLVAVALVVAALVLSALIPRVWAQYIGNVVDGSIVRGTWMGVAAGAAFTFLPLLGLLAAWRSRAGKGWPVFWLIVSAILALPNLMTWWIVLGTTSAAEAGQQILNVDGPGFRSGTTAGALVGLALFLVVGWWLLVRSRNRKQSDRAAGRASQSDDVDADHGQD